LFFNGFLRGAAARNLLQPIEALSSTKIFLKAAQSATFKNIFRFYSFSQFG